jgi:hypothetical protein
MVDSTIAFISVFKVAGSVTNFSEYLGHWSSYWLSAKDVSRNTSFVCMLVLLICLYIINQNIFQNLFLGTVSDKY